MKLNNNMIHLVLWMYFGEEDL